jgi:hypothetical protein
MSKNSRKSPNIKASESNPGLILKGNDGNYWIVKELPNGTHRWIIYKKKGERETKCYIHDNGGLPFLVRATDSMINIYLGTYDYDEDDCPDWHYDELIESYTKFKQFFVGIDNSKKLYGKYYGNPKYNGNSILIHIDKDEYVYVGESIYKFNSIKNDRIIKYYSPVGNSDVPYPYAIGENYTYLMLEKKYIDNDDIDKGDPYDQLYGWNKKNKKDNSNFKKLKTKLIHARNI